MVRRLGYIAVKAHETMISALIAQGDQRLAECFNDAFKPVCDYLLNFELENVSRETIPEGDDDGAS